MTEPVESAAPETADAATAQPVEGAEPPQPKLTETVDYWKQQSRQNEARAKANADAAKELQTIKDRDLSELDRAKKSAAETAAELAEIKRQHAYLTRGVPVPPADTSPDAIAVFVEQLMAWKGTGTASAATAPVNPKPDKSQGAQPADASAAEVAAYEQIKAQNWGHLTNQTRK